MATGVLCVAALCLANKRRTVHLAVATSKEACLFVFSLSCTKSENAAHDDLIHHPKPETQDLSVEKIFSTFAFCQSWFLQSCVPYGAQN